MTPEQYQHLQNLIGICAMINVLFTTWVGWVLAGKTEQPPTK